MNFCQSDYESDCESDCEKAIKASLETYKFEKKNEKLRLEQAKEDEELRLQIAAIQELEKKAVTSEDEALTLAISLSLCQVQPKETAQARTKRLKGEEETFSEHVRINARKGNTFPQAYTQKFLSLISFSCQ